MEKTRILWADDEIDLLKPHVMFLEEKGYDVTTVNNGDDAVDKVDEVHFDIVFLDENMPGLNGLETLKVIKSKQPSLPVIMITKSEEESIMEDAIGSKISDYLIKPVNPKQILLSLKKNLENKKLVSQKTSSNYQQEFREIGMRLSDRLDTEEWKELYQKLVYWELELDTGDASMMEILRMQKNEANHVFSKFVENNYEEWVNNQGDDVPLMSHSIFKEKIAPKIDEGPLFLLVIDNLRYDQWKVLQPIVQERFLLEEDDLYYSILPTATHYARNALFAGMMPLEIERKYPKLWLNEEDEGGKNMNEGAFLAGQLKNLNKDIKYSYNKITNLAAGKKLSENFSNLLNNHLNVIVYNFVDMLSHARTEMEVIRELADDEAAYRSLTESWFEHSALKEIVNKIADSGQRIVITTDHGTIRVAEPSKVIGDRNTNTNLRYKVGKNLNYQKKDVLAISNPLDVHLPKTNVSSSFIFVKENKFFVYPNNYNYYMNYYRDTFQHGGISLEEILVPVVSLKAK